MISLSTIDFSLPLTDPVLKFMLILFIILAAPLVLNRLKIPPLLGLIIAGAVIGPHGLNLMLRDSSIILSGTAGLLYIMFLAGLGIDMGDFKKNSIRSLIFGMYTFITPMILGFFVSLWIFGFNTLTSVLLAGMIASHTLIAYPIINKLGIGNDKAVSLTIGGTMITDILSLLVLSIIVNIVTGHANSAYWISLGVSIVLFGVFVSLAFPLIGRWFFKRVNDNISQYIFVLLMLFFASFLAKMVGLESIIGAFLSGLTLNRLIPRSSPLMNRIEFVGNAIFIPFFLLSVGMLINYEAFFTGIRTIEIGVVLIITALSAKYIAAWMTQKTFRLSVDQRRVIFGLSSSQAAATLATVTVGYNVILGTSPTGEPIRLLSENVLNGTIMMILVNCTVASFAAQRGAQNIALRNISEEEKKDKKYKTEHILIPVSNKNTVEELVNLSLAIKSRRNTSGLYALKVIDNRSSDGGQILKESRLILRMAVDTAAAADTYMKDLLRYDLSISNAITSVIKEQDITDVVLGLHKERDIPADFLGQIVEDLLRKSTVTTFIYKSVQPLATIKRHRIIIPRGAEKEIGFHLIIDRLKNVMKNTGTKAILYASVEVLEVLRKSFAGANFDILFHEFSDWENFPTFLVEVGTDDDLWVMLSRKDGISYNSVMPNIPGYLNQLHANNFVLAYPPQVWASDGTRYLT